MPHRSHPPSFFNPPRISPAAFVAMMRPINTPRAVVSPPAGQPPPSGRVRVVPTPDGIVKVVGVTRDNVWVAEYTCRVEDFGEDVIRAMERRVLAKEHGTLRIVR